MSGKTWGDILNEAKEGGDFALLPLGTYVGRVHKAKIKEASTGKKGIGVTWQVQAGPEKGGFVHKDFWVDPEEPTQMGNFIKAMKVMGATFEGMPTDFEAGLEAVADQIMGGVAMIKVQHRPWQGETRHEVAPWDVKPYEGPALDESSAAAAAAAPAEGDGSEAPVPPKTPF